MAKKHKEAKSGSILFKALKLCQIWFDNTKMPFVFNLALTTNTEDASNGEFSVSFGLSSLKGE